VSVTTAAAPRASWIVLAAAGIAVGLVYTLSPLMVWSALALVPLIRYAARDLPPDEQRRISSLLVIALVPRVLAVAFLFVTTNHSVVPFGSFFGDEAYFIYRSMWLRNVAFGIPIHRADLIYAFDDYSQTSQLYVYAFVQMLVGFAPYGLHLVGIVLYFTAAILLFRLVRPSFGAAPSLVGLVLMLALPSLFAWSISALKEPLFFALTALALVTATSAMRAQAWRTAVLMALVAIGSAVALETVRRAGLAIEAASIGGGVALAWLIVRPRLLIATAIAATLIAAAALSRPSVQLRAASSVVEASRFHRGHVWTPGHSYRLLDDRLYDEDVNLASMTLPEAGRYLAGAFFAYLTVPLPNQIYSTAALAFIPEQMVWYAQVALAPFGLVMSFRRDVLVASLLLMHSIVATVPVALTSGNIGTLVRHRGFTLPYLVWISAVGACELVARSRAVARTEVV